MLLNELKKVFSVFCFTGEIYKNDENTFVLKMECYNEDLGNLEKDWVFQDIMKAFTRIHPNKTLKFNGIELEYDKFCKDGYVVFEKHFENYSETNGEFE